MRQKTIGQEGEDTACTYLEDKGFKILHRNFRCRFGEIDIIAQKGNIIVFVEVKKRGSYRFGKGYEAVSQKKIEKIIKTAEYFMMAQKGEYLCRFDVISIDSDQIEHIENAFTT
ncbi:MAG: YraN family protein [Calditerrivibrio sp.]|nr:YraN family protein [Calditerrivibrio sp.]